jgi:hypothetical protein
MIWGQDFIVELETWQMTDEEPQMRNWPASSTEVRWAIETFIEGRIFNEGIPVGDGEHHRPGDYMEPYFFAWLDEGLGFEFTAGSFSIFIEAAMRIIDIVMCQPTLLGRDSDSPPLFVGIFDPKVKRPLCFDPAVYERLKFKFLMSQVERLADVEDRIKFL